jgi:formamidopyrimidine-DNA glycosylase
MDQQVVGGVGNIYASEALFRAGIDPRRPAGSIGRARYDRLAETVREVLGEAIAAGGTTIRDFTDAGGKPGYFAQQLKVYGREGEACPGCGRSIIQLRLGGRSTYFCRKCQR